MEAPEQARQVERAGRQHRAHRDGAAQAPLGLADRVPGRLGGRQRGPGLGQQYLPRVGQHDPVAVPVEQDRAEVALQGLIALETPDCTRCSRVEARVKDT